MHSDWIQLGQEIFYKKFCLYPISWGGLNLNDFIIGAAALGGPIALLRNAQGSASKATLIFIFSSSGTKIASIKWSGNRLILMNWSSSEELICVQEDGKVNLYDIFGTDLRTFNPDPEFRNYLVASAKTFSNSRHSKQDTGIAFLTRSNKFYILSNTREAKCRKYPDIPNVQACDVTAWSVFRGDQSTYIIASCDNNIWQITSHDCLQMNIDWSNNAPVVDIAVSSNSGHIALFSENGNIWLGSSDLYTKYCEVSTGKNKPKQLTWCGTGAVCLLYDITMELISVNGEQTTVYFDSIPSYLVQEIDAVRILSNVTHDMVQKVPRVTVKTLGIGSMSSGALLLEASIGFQEESTRATDCLAIIKDNFSDAVTHCLQCAQYEYSPENQIALLKAAHFGATFLPEIEKDSFKTATTWLRVLNAVRDHKVGLPLTWNQLENMSIPVLLDRLVARRLFPLALMISKYLKIPESEGSARILAHWACYKVNQPSQKGDDQLALEFNGKLGYTPGISYTDIAKRANKVGRRTLAIKLIEYECRLNEQVSLLLSLGEDQAALKKSIKSGDADLIYSVLKHINKQMSLSEFLMTIRNFSVVQSLHLRNLQQNDIEKYRDILIQEDDFHSQALLRVKEALKPIRIDSQLSSLQSAGDLFKRAKDEWSTRIVSEKIKLQRTQVTLEEKEGKEYIGKSLRDSLIQLLNDGKDKEAEKLSSQFKYGDKKFFVLKMISLSENQRWEDLLNLSKTKKIPVGLEFFVDVCLRRNNQDEAKKYLARIKDESKISHYIKSGLLGELSDVMSSLSS